MNAIQISTNAPLRTAKSLLDAISPPKLNTYRVHWAWAQGRKIHTAVTTWLHPGDAQAALKNFKQRRPEALMAEIVKEAA